jgi:hypothetical protein
VTAARTQPPQTRSSASDLRRALRVEELLAGELLEDGSGLGYDLEGHHLGLVASGGGAREAIGEMAEALERCPLLVEAREGSTWAWLGGRTGFDSGDLERVLSREWPAGMIVALGEPAQGAAGWRLTHRQARAALSIARRGDQAVVRYADVALLASILRDDLLATSLRRLYLEPLEGERDGGEALRRTLRGYFAADRNASVAGAALGISRQAVARRLRAAEQRIGRSIDACGFELEAALRFESLDARPRFRA